MKARLNFSICNEIGAQLVDYGIILSVYDGKATRFTDSAQRG